MARQTKTEVHVVVRVWEIDTDAGAASEPKRLKHEVTYDKEFLSGTTDYSTMDRVWSTDDSATVTPVDLDLVGTANLPSKLDSGLNVNFTDLCVVCVTNEADSSGGSLNLGAGSNPFAGMWLASGDGAKILPQGILLWVAPGGAQPVATTGDILRLVASAGTIAGKALVAGRAL